MNGKNITEKHLKRLENLIELVEDEWGEYDDSLCEELLDFVRSKVLNPIKKRKSSNQGDMSRDSLILSDHGHIPLIAPNGTE